MGTKIEKLNSTYNRKINSYMYRLQGALNFEPSEWEWDGSVFDYGRGSGRACVCNHPIRFGFPLYRHGRSIPIIVGRECVKNYNIPAATVERMKDTLIAIKASLAEAEKIAKENQKKEEIKVLLDERESIFDRYYDKCDVLKKNNILLPEHIYIIYQGGYMTDPNKYVNRSALIKRLLADIALLKKSEAEVDLIPNTPKTSKYEVGQNIEITAEYLGQSPTDYGPLHKFKSGDVIFLRWGEYRYPLKRDRLYQITAAVKKTGCYLGESQVTLKIAKIALA